MTNVVTVIEELRNIQTTAMKKFNNIWKPSSSTPLTPRRYTSTGLIKLLRHLSYRERATLYRHRRQQKELQAELPVSLSCLRCRYRVARSLYDRCLRSFIKPVDV